MKPHPWHVGVAIPARNEAALLPACLDSILAAVEHLGGNATADVVVVADSSTDGTAEIAREALKCRGLVRAVSVGAVGAARRIATQCLMDRNRGSLECFWIANTDADCVVPSNWLSEQLVFARLGVEAVAGIVRVEDFADHGPEVSARFRSSYLIEPDGSHPHVHGANMGFRADAYLRAGGWCGLETAEDHDLWGRLSIAGAQRHSTSRLEVQTSGRRTGRAPNGFAAALAAHNGTAA